MLLSKGRDSLLGLGRSADLAFAGQNGRLSQIKEARVRGNGYWYAYRKSSQYTLKG